MYTWSRSVGLQLLLLHAHLLYGQLLFVLLLLLLQYSGAYGCVWGGYSRFGCGGVALKEVPAPLDEKVSSTRPEIRRR